MKVSKDAAQEKADAEADKQLLAMGSVEGAKAMHYDKEDLISFHQLFISKPLTKAAQELDYEHPTVI